MDAKKVIKVLYITMFYFVFYYRCTTALNCWSLVKRSTYRICPHFSAITRHSRGFSSAIKFTTASC